MTTEFMTNSTIAPNSFNETTLPFIVVTFHDKLDNKIENKTSFDTVETSLTTLPMTTVDTVTSSTNNDYSSMMSTTDLSESRNSIETNTVNSVTETIDNVNQQLITATVTNAVPSTTSDNVELLLTSTNAFLPTTVFNNNEQTTVLNEDDTTVTENEFPEPTFLMTSTVDNPIASTADFFMTDSILATTMPVEQETASIINEHSTNDDLQPWIDFRPTTPLDSLSSDDYSDLSILSTTISPNGNNLGFTSITFGNPNNNNEEELIPTTGSNLWLQTSKTYSDVDNDSGLTIIPTTTFQNNYYTFNVDDFTTISDEATIQRDKNEEFKTTHSSNFATNDGSEIFETTTPTNFESTVNFPSVSYVDEITSSDSVISGTDSTVADGDYFDVTVLETTTGYGGLRTFTPLNVFDDLTTDTNEEFTNSVTVNDIKTTFDVLQTTASIHGNNLNTATGSTIPFFSIYDDVISPTDNDQNHATDSDIQSTHSSTESTQFNDDIESPILTTITPIISEETDAQTSEDNQESVFTQTTTIPGFSGFTNPITDPLIIITFGENVHATVPTHQVTSATSSQSEGSNDISATTLPDQNFNGTIVVDQNNGFTSETTVNEMPQAFTRETNSITEDSHNNGQEASSDIAITVVETSTTSKQDLITEYDGTSADLDSLGTTAVSETSSSSPTDLTFQDITDISNLGSSNSPVPNNDADIDIIGTSVSGDFGQLSTEQSYEIDILTTTTPIPVFNNPTNTVNEEPFDDDFVVTDPMSLTSLKQDITPFDDESDILTAVTTISITSPSINEETNPIFHDQESSENPITVAETSELTLTTTPISIVDIITTTENIQLAMTTHESILGPPSIVARDDSSNIPENRREACQALYCSFEPDSMCAQYTIKSFWEISDSTVDDENHISIEPIDTNNFGYISGPIRWARMLTIPFTLSHSAIFSFDYRTAVNQHTMHFNVLVKRNDTFFETLLTMPEIFTDSNPKMWRKANGLLLPGSYEYIAFEVKNLHEHEYIGISTFHLNEFLGGDYCKSH